jgi:hypothetical protein
MTNLEFSSQPKDTPETLKIENPGNASLAKLQELLVDYDMYRADLQLEGETSDESIPVIAMMGDYGAIEIERKPEKIEGELRGAFVMLQNDGTGCVAETMYRVIDNVTHGEHSLGDAVILRHTDVYPIDPTAVDAPSVQRGEPEVLSTEEAADFALLLEKLTTK